MSIIYEPRGKAREFAALAANIYKGCSHACTYCYAPSATFTKREKFSDSGYIRPRDNWFDQIKKDCKKLSDKKCQEIILMSFTSDPYQPCEKKFKVTRQAMKILNKYGLNFGILTKGGISACRDFDLLSKNKKNQFACTLTTDIDSESLEWEHMAALPGSRIKALEQAHSLGIDTWVSFEPVINPDAVPRLIDRTHKFVNLYKVGKLNYHKHSKSIDWSKYLKTVESKLLQYGKKYIVKKDLEAYRKIAA